MLYNFRYDEALIGNFRDFDLIEILNSDLESFIQLKNLHERLINQVYFREYIQKMGLTDVDWLIEKKKGKRFLVKNQRGFILPFYGLASEYRALSNDLRVFLSKENFK